jgi:hypothetical protein
MIYLNYVILPIVNLILMTVYISMPSINKKDIPIFSWVIFFNMVCFSRLIEFWGSLKKRIFDDARIYLEKMSR